MQRHAQVVDRARERGQVVDEVDVALDVQVLGDVVVDEREVLAAEVSDVLEGSRVEVVDADDTEVALNEVVAEMGAEEAGPAGHDRGGHRRGGTDAPRPPWQAFSTPFPPFPN